MTNSFDPEVLEKILLLLDQHETKELFALGAESTIDREQLMSMRLPLGISVMEAEKLLCAVTRLFAIPYPIINQDGIQYWFFPTRKTIGLLHSLSMRASSGSSLDRARTGEYQAVLDKDALKIATDHLIELAGLEMSEERTETNDKIKKFLTSNPDILKRNIYRLLKEIPEQAAKEDFYSVSSLDRIIDTLTDGFADTGLVRSMRISGTSSITENRIKEVLDVMDEGWSEMGPLLDSIMARWSIQYISPYGDLTLMASDIFIRQNLVRKGYHLLQFIPFFTTYIPGKRGLRKMEQTDYALDIPYGDLTKILENTLQEMSTALDTQLESYQTIIKNEERVRKLLRDDLSLNHRQRSILERALRLPDASFCINYHMKRHDITYSTARKDLFDLAELGYLRIDKDQKAYAFFAAHDLQEKLESRRGATFSVEK